MHVVLGAPGSGKSSVVPLLARLLPQHVVLDWDGLMDPAGQLAGTAIRTTPRTWAGYDALIKAVVVSAGPARVVLFGVKTPDELQDWPDANWSLIDCTDDERARRLRGRGAGDAEVAEALADARAYRQLGLHAIDATPLTPADLARRLAGRIAGTAQ